MQYIRNIIWLVMLLPSTSFAEDKFLGKIAVVDVESIFEHSIAIADIKKSINIISNHIQEELSTKEAELKVIEADLIKKQKILGETKFADQVVGFNQKVSATQQEMQHRKSALEQAHASALAEVHKHTIEIISELSKKNNFNIVFPSTQAMYIDNNLNITSEVISILNERLKLVEIKYDYKEKNY